MTLYNTKAMTILFHVPWAQPKAIETDRRSAHAQVCHVASRVWLG